MLGPDSELATNNPWAAVPSRFALTDLLQMPALTHFTARQRQVAYLIAAGCSNEQIGTRLGISSRTAKAHSDTLRLKLGVVHRRQIPLAYYLATGDGLLGSAAPVPITSAQRMPG